MAKWIADIWGPHVSPIFHPSHLHVRARDGMGTPRPSQCGWGRGHCSGTSSPWPRHPLMRAGPAWLPLRAAAPFRADRAGLASLCRARAPLICATMRWSHTPPRAPAGRHRASRVPSHGSPASNMHACFSSSFLPAKRRIIAFGPHRIL